MKSIVFALCVVTAGISSMVAQSSPAPASKAPGKESMKLTPEEWTRAVEYLKQTQKDFLASIEGVSEAQWKFKAAPDRWSIAETAEHIGLAEQLIWDRINKMMKNSPAPEKRAEVQG